MAGGARGGWGGGWRGAGWRRGWGGGWGWPVGAGVVGLGLGYGYPGWGYAGYGGGCGYGGCGYGGCGIGDAQRRGPGRGQPQPLTAKAISQDEAQKDERIVKTSDAQKSARLPSALLDVRPPAKAADHPLEALSHK